LFKNFCSERRCNLTENDLKDIYQFFSLKFGGNSININNVRKLFKKLDSDNNGVINKRELKPLIKIFIDEMSQSIENEIELKRKELNDNLNLSSKPFFN